jgi:hypothetical protein
LVKSAKNLRRVVTMEVNETRNRIIMTIGAVVGLVIGIASGSIDGIVGSLIGAWVGVGIGGNIMPFFSELGYKIRHGFSVGRAQGQSAKDNLLATLVYIVFVIIWRLLKNALYGTVLYIIQMVAGDWYRFGD